MKHFLLILLSVIVFAGANARSDTAFVSLQVGGVTKASTITVVDSITGSPLSSSISNVVVQNINPEFANVALLSGTTVKAAPVAAGTGTAIVSCNVSYVDPGDGLQKNQTKSVLLSYTVTGTPHGANLTLSFN
jgi:hypothetical protein